MRLYRKYFKKIKVLWNNEDILQLFIKFSESELSDGEQKKVNKWVHAYKDRQLMFENLKKTIKFQKKLSVANQTDATDILNELKETFPEEFDGIPGDTTPFLLLRILRISVDQINWEICWAIANGNRWIGVISIAVRIVILVVIVLIVYKILLPL